MKLSHSETAHLCRGLSLLLHAGITLNEGVYLLAEEETDSFRTLLLELGGRMDMGAPLSDAMEESGAFPVHVTGMVRIGEETGRMEQTLDALAEYCEERFRTVRQIKNALAYPSMILLLMLGVLAVLLIKVLPVFDAVYASLGSRLTGVSAGLLYLGQLLQAAMPVLLVVLTFLAAAVVLFARWTAFREKVTAWYVCRFGDRGAARKFNNARFARGLAMALSSGMPLEEAIELSQKLLSDVPGAAARCAQCAEALQAGRSLSDAMGDAGLLPPAQSRMLAVGLRGGNADRVMEDVADKMMEEAGEALEHTVSKIEPAMVLAASLLVGVILLSVMLPLVNIMSTIG